MENISKMEMASALFQKPYIKVEKAFFGFITKVTYTPTNSPVVGRCLDFSLVDGEKVQRLIAAAPNDVEAILQKDGRPTTFPNGHWRLSICYSQDHKFAALHFSEYVGFEYKAIGETRFAEGDAAEKLLRPFVK